jgi:ABC-type sugar transport system ATPase subunit
MSRGEPLIRLEGVGKTFDDGTVAVKDLNLEIEDEAFVCFLGPSGCGKTTTLRLIAGLETPTTGEIFLRERRITHWPPQRRGVGLVFQSYALFQHMTVQENLAFGLDVRGTPRGEIARRVRDMAARLELEDELGVRASRLDLSTMQRVAVGRTLVAEPNLLLLDEPLNNFQAGLREQMRAQLKSWQQQFGRTTIYVTHDQEEAMTLGDRIVVMRDGEVEQEGPPEQVYRRPETLFVAGFIGLPPMNLLPARLDGVKGRVSVPEASFELDVRMKERFSGDVVIGVRPEHLLPAGVERDGRPHFRGEVDLVRPAAARTIVDVRLEGGAIVRALVRGMWRGEPGEAVTLAFEPEAIVLFDRSTGLRID